MNETKKKKIKISQIGKHIDELHNKVKNTSTSSDIETKKKITKETIDKEQKAALEMATRILKGVGLEHLIDDTKGTSRVKTVKSENTTNPTLVMPQQTEKSRSGRVGNAAEFADFINNKGTITLSDALTWLRNRSAKGSETDFLNNLLSDYCEQVTQFKGSAQEKIAFKRQKVNEVNDKFKQTGAKYPVFHRNGKPNTWLYKNIPNLMNFLERHDLF